MKVCVLGAGAVGGHLAARLAHAGHCEVSVIARGAQLEAIRRNGITLKSGREEIVGEPAAATDDPSSLPKQDLVIVTVKAHAVPALAETIEKLLAPDGVALFPLNGLTWWWNIGKRNSKGALPLLDPEGGLWNRLRERSLGCVVYSPNEVVSPGVILHIGGNRFVIGEPNDRQTARAQAVVDLFDQSGLPAETTADIRADIWRKLMNNAPGNSIAALTRRGHYDTWSNPGLKEVGIAIMRESLEVAAAMGWDLRKDIDPEKAAARVTPGPMSTPSMLQDVLLNRSVEVESHLGQMQAFAREAGVKTPTIDVVLPLLRGLDLSIRSTK